MNKKVFPPRTTLVFLLLFLVYSSQKLHGQTPTLQSVTTPPGNATTNDIYANRILGQYYNRSSIMIGTNNTYYSGSVKGQSYIFGFQNSVATPGYQLAVGSYNSITSGYSNALIGKSNTSSGDRCFVFGYTNIAAGDRNILLGMFNQTQAISKEASAIGSRNKAYNEGSSAIGHGNLSNGHKSAALGSGNYAFGKYAAAFGIQNIASGEKSVAFGYQSISSGLYSISFGKENNVSGTRGVAVGSNNSVTGAYAHAFGRDLTNSKPYSVKVGVSNTAFLMVLNNGNVGIGTENPQAKLAVNGTIFAKKVKVTLAAADWPDYVFDSSYKLRSLKEVESYISINKHLPDMPTGQRLTKDGVDLLQSQSLLLQKIEELTLYTIQLNKKVEMQSLELKNLKHKILKKKK